jgi:hypothetical protein
MSSFSITDEQISFATEAHGAMPKILATLSPAKAAGLVDAVTRISAAAQERYGVTASADEIVTLPGVKSHVLGGGTLDIEGALFTLQQSSVRIARAIANDAEPQDSGLLSESELAQMTPQNRMNYAREHGLG